MAHPRIGIALGSGSARGLAHIGIIEALLEMGIEPDIVCGSSSGALVGAAYVANRLSALKQFAQNLKWREIVSLLDIRFLGGGMIDGKRIVELMCDLQMAAPIESYPKAYAAVATDLATGREVWLREGPINEAVRASFALPAIFSPVEIGGRWLLDGGLVNPVPVSVCRALGADVVIAVNLNGDRLGRPSKTSVAEDADSETVRTSSEFLRRLLAQIPARIKNQDSAITPKLLEAGTTTPGYLDVIANSIIIMQNRITRARLADDPPEVVLMPRLHDIGALEFNRADEAIAEGRDCVRQALSLMRRYI